MLSKGTLYEIPLPNYPAAAGNPDVSKPPKSKLRNWSLQQRLRFFYKRLI